MPNSSIILVCYLLISLCALTLPANAGQQTLREEKKLILDGKEEIWRLEWAGKTSSACGPTEPDWYTCPCIGFAFGESGSLTLVRLRAGQKEERLKLDDYFLLNDFQPASSGEGKAVLQRWKPQKDDMDNAEKSGFEKMVEKRPITSIMKFADYDHDGRPTEFILQIGTLPCGKRMNIAVGISKSNPRLHVFSSVASPNKSLVLQQHHWEALKKSKKTVKVIDWQCGDHGSENEEVLELKALHGTISAIRYRFSCTDNGRGQLLSSTPF